MEFDLSDSLFQGFVFVWHMFYLDRLTREVDSLLRAEPLNRSLRSRLAGGRTEVFADF